MPVEPIAVTRRFDQFRPFEAVRERAVLDAQAILPTEEERSSNRRDDAVAAPTPLEASPESSVARELERPEGTAPAARERSLAEQIDVSRVLAEAQLRFASEIGLSMAVEPEPLAAPQVYRAQEKHQLVILGSLVVSRLLHDPKTKGGPSLPSMISKSV